MNATPGACWRPMPKESAAALAHENLGRRPINAVSASEAAAVVKLASITDAGVNS